MDSTADSTGRMRYQDSPMIGNFLDDFCRAIRTQKLKERIMQKHGKQVRYGNGWAVWHVDRLGCKLSELKQYLPSPAKAPLKTD